MEKFHLAIVIISALILGGCATPPAEGVCPQNPPHWTLNAHDDGGPGKPGGGRTFIRIEPDTRKIVIGCPSVLNNPQGHLITVTSPKTWLSHPATKDKKITFGNAVGADKEIVKFKIHVDGIGELDPRAHLRR